MSERTTFKDENDASSTLFDLRYLIGGLFTFYGLLLILASFFVPHVKSGDIDINLWLGIGMLILALFLLGCARLPALRIEGESALARAENAADDAPTRPDRSH